MKPRTRALPGQTKAVLPSDRRVREGLGGFLESSVLVLQDSRPILGHTLEGIIIIIRKRKKAFLRSFGLGTRFRESVDRASASSSLDWF